MEIVLVSRTGRRGARTEKIKLKVIDAVAFICLARKNNNDNNN